MQAGVQADARIIVEEFEATPRPSIRTFQTLSTGKTEQSGIPGSVGAPPEPPPGGGGVDGSVGWLDASSGFVPAVTSAPSA